MRSRRVQTWVWWLLPFLVARAFMPVGFMAQTVQGQLQIVFCTAGYTKVQGESRAKQLSTQSDNQSHDQSQYEFSCPFAHASAAPLLDVSSNEPIPFIPTAEIFPSVESRQVASGPPRFIATRGPPILA